MNKTLLILAITVLTFTMAGCLKSDDKAPSTCIPNSTGVPTATEISAVQSYLSSKSITATQDPGGFFYVKHAQGTGATPTLSSTVITKYTGFLTNGNVFTQDITGTSSFVLSGLILGWRRGLPLIQKGGSITLYIPPSLGYDCSQIGAIPPGSILIYDIELIDVQ